MKLEFSGQIFVKYFSIKLMKIRPVGAQLFHVDGKRDITKQIVVFSNFANAPTSRKRGGGNCLLRSFVSSVHLILLR